MKKILTFLLLLSSCALSAQEKVTFMPQWTPQAQFAGYYVALEKGFYKELGLDVTIQHISTTTSKSSLENVLDGTVDICTGQLIQGIMRKNKGEDLINVLQTSQNCSLMCISNEPLKSVSDISGKRIGRWKSAFGETADMFCQEYGISNVEWIYFSRGINLFVSKAIDATLCYSYSEYIDILFARGEIPEDNVIEFGKLGFNFPEDAIMTTNSYYESHRDAVEKFKQASIEGWNYARDHKDEALEIVMEYMKKNNIATNRYHQKLMLDEVLRLQVNQESGAADFSHLSESLFSDLNDEMISTGFISDRVNYNDFIK